MQRIGRTDPSGRHPLRRRCTCPLSRHDKLGQVAAPHTELIEAATRLLRPHPIGDRLVGNVASTLVSAAGRRYDGVCIDTGSGTGFCAEHSAIAAMVTAGEYQIRCIVAVWRDEQDRLYVLPPCGRCREFIRQIDPTNLQTQIVLGADRSARLWELLPEHEWQPLVRDR